MTFPSIRIEGAILSGDLLAKVERDDFPGQKPADFGLPGGAKVKDEIARAWAEAQSLWAIYRRRLDHLTGVDLGTTETRNLWIVPFLGLLGYPLERPERAEVILDKTYALSHRLPGRDGFPVHVVGPRHADPSVPPDRSTLDVKAVAGPRMSPHALLQEYLNLTEHLYGLVTNGLSLRLLRDSSRLIKLSYLEFDLERIFTEQLFADFAVLFRLLHVSRLPASREHAAQCLLERYHQDALESGARIRDGLRDAVEKAIVALGNGFLAHRDNDALRSALQAGTLSAKDYYAHLLRLIYRLLFLMVIEERGLVYPRTADRRFKAIYDQHYSLARLRRLAGHRFLADKNHADLWLALRATFRLFEADEHAAKLGLSPLAGRLFGAEALGPLNAAQLDNATLLGCLRELSLFEQPGTHQVIRVNYGAIATEEFGSVYESLLELHPTVTSGTPPRFAFKQAAGNERKTSGSYYTPSSLVECLLDSALDPVLEDRLKNFTKLGYQSADAAVLALKVCDPACGSGHFLIAAAQRIARRLAVLRAGDEEPSLELLRHTLREVISHCIYGVDINPMSVELCKVGLWLEAMEAGKPLSFLDHHIRCGNSLLGATPELIAKGIPDDAFTAIEGDDKRACAALKKLNARERAGFGELFALEDRATFERLQQAAVAVENLPDDSVRAVEQKSAAFEQLQQNYDLQKATDLANLWCAAFVIRKRMADERPSANGESAAASQPKTDAAAPAPEQKGLFGETFAAPATKEKKSANRGAAPALYEAIGITSGHLRDFAKGAGLTTGLFSKVTDLAKRYGFFHWHLAFPEVLKRGGFDAMLGNPPWEKVKLQEREFFAAARPDIAEAQTASIREKMIERLAVEEPLLFAEFRAAVQQAESETSFVSKSGRFPLGAVGDTNTYPLFTEAAISLISSAGRAGLIVKTGILADYSLRQFFSHLVENGHFVSGFDFSNRKLIFPAVVANERFTLLTLAGAGSTGFRVSILNEEVSDLEKPRKVWELTREDLFLINPNTKTCPLFQTSSDARLVSHVYRRLPILVDEANGDEGNPWGVLYLRMFDMTLDSKLFRDLETLQSKSTQQPSPIWNNGQERFLALLEGKLYDLFDHRHGTFDGVSRTTRFGIKAEPNHPTAQQRIDPTFECLPRYWILEAETHSRYVERLGFHPAGVLTFRDVCRTHTDFRTVRAAICPGLAAGNKAPLLLFPGLSRQEHSIRSLLLCANLCTFALDYIARQKFAGGSLNRFILIQFPFLPATAFDEPAAWAAWQSLKDWFLPRVLELTYTAWDLEPFAQDCGWSGPPFRWDEERRFQLRCELDAAFFHLYLGTEEEWRGQPETLTASFPTPRDAVSYIMDTFPIVRRKDEERFNGDYRTKRVILEIYDALATAMKTSTPYPRRLTPPPADPTCCHPARDTLH